MAVILGAVLLIAVVSRLRSADEQVQWRNDFTAARAESARTGKPTFLYLTAEWCGPCQQMKRTTWSDAKVAAALEAHFVPLRIDVDQHPDLAQRYNAETIPRMIVLDKSGSPRAMIGRAVESDDLLQWLNALPTTMPVASR